LGDFPEDPAKTLQMSLAPFTRKDPPHLEQHVFVGIRPVIEMLVMTRKFG
jgi:hypothetical protein